MTPRKQHFRHITTALWVAATLFHSSHLHHGPVFAEASRQEQSRIEIAVDNSDEYASASIAILSPRPPHPRLGINASDHARIQSMLINARYLVDEAKKMLQSNDATLQMHGREILEKATNLFTEAKQHVAREMTQQMMNRPDNASQLRGSPFSKNQEIPAAELMDAARTKYSSHNLAQVHEDEDRAMDIARQMAEILITFPECMEQLLEECIRIIGNQLGSLGLSESEVEYSIQIKRNATQEGYNKVVIITNNEATHVKGRAGDGIVSYPFQWDDELQGPKTLGVDGRWNCHEQTPEECCEMIKLSVPNKDVHGKYIECHIFVPFGGVGNPRRDDRVIINLSPDGRVHEAPIIT